jgi:hypothetical protein
MMILCSTGGLLRSLASRKVRSPSRLHNQLLLLLLLLLQVLHTMPSVLLLLLSMSCCFGVV